MTENSISMEDKPQSAEAASSPGGIIWLMFGLALVLMGYIFWGGFVDMEFQWQRDEYSHGYMIPMVALYIIWQKQQQLPAATGAGSWLAVLGLFLALLVYFVGEISTVYEVVQYAFLVSLFMLILSFFGWGVMRVIYVALIYLIFMIPLPQFIYHSLSAELQLVSSTIGVAVIRLFDISVYLEGNVIDLGVYQLQVVEACSGLRYLFPLMSFGFLIAYLFKAPMWQRAVLFLSTVPITVLMNSFRIGVIGVTVEYWGIEMAEGFLHDFEGWVIFMGCLGVLSVEMMIFHRLSGSKENLWDRIDLDMPDSTVSLSDFKLSWSKQRPFLICLVMLVVAASTKPLLEARAEVELERKSFNTFPLYYGKWLGRESSIDDNILGELKLTDYLMADYTPRAGGLPMNFYVAYYADQRAGSAIHSPRTCIPGGGWKFDGLDQVVVPGVVNRSGEPLMVNRVVIRKDKDAQILYYWFEERGRNITSEYAAKWYKFLDSLLLNRTDGSLIRVVAPVPQSMGIEDVEKEMVGFVQTFYPLLEDYIPGKEGGDK